VMGIAILAGYLALGTLATRLARQGIDARHLFAIGFALSVASLGLILSRAIAFTYLPWTLYGVGCSVNVLAFTVLSQGFPRELTARANTALNLIMFSASFLTQWGIGVVVDFAGRALAVDVAGGLRLAFLLVFALDVAALAWFALGWKRHARLAPAVVPA